MMLKLCLLVLLFAVVYSQPFNNPSPDAKAPSNKKFSIQKVKRIIDGIFSGLSSGDNGKINWKRFVPSFVEPLLPDDIGSNKKPQEAAGNNVEQAFVVGPPQEAMDPWRRR